MSLLVIGPFHKTYKVGSDRFSWELRHRLGFSALKSSTNYFVTNSGPLGQVGHRVAMSVCVSVCLSVLLGSRSLIGPEIA